MKARKLVVAVGLAVAVFGAAPGRANDDRERDPGAAKSDRISERTGSEPSGGAPPRSNPPDRGTSSRTASGHRHHRTSGGWHVGIGWHGWGPGWGWWGWSPYWYGAPWGYTVVYPDPDLRHGALDTDLSPERAEVWVDGQRLGVADDFDGFPRYLWLEAGTYDVVFYLPGYETLARQVTIYAGQVIDVEDRLERGESIHPNDLGPKSHDRRDARLERDRERRRKAEERWSGDDESWSRRSSRDAPLDARGEPARVRLEVSPEDASVYLDGRFLGTGRDLARLRAGLLVDPGSHTLEVVRPGYAPARRTLEVEAGSDEEVEVELEAET